MIPLFLLSTTIARADDAHVQLPPTPPPAARAPLFAPTDPPAPTPPSPIAATPTTAPAEAPVPQVRLTSTATATATVTNEDAGPTKSAPRSPNDSTVLHGFRLGYGYVMNYDQPLDALNGQSLKQKIGLRAPSHFLLGYEVVYRVVSQSWLNVILMGNGMIAGLEQSKFLPSGNLLIGAEIRNSFQIGVGTHLEPLKGEEAHAIIAAGWTPRIGTIYTPVHAYFIPDVDGMHRLGITTGVTF